MARRQTGNPKGRGARKRRGSGEDFTEAKANAVEMRQATGSLPLPQPNDWSYHKKQILGTLDRKRTAQTMYTNAIKAAQKAGINTKSLLDANDVKRQNDPKKTVDYLQQLAFGMSQEGIPIHITVSDTLVADTLGGAEQRGYDDATNGRHANNDYPQNSDMSKRYMRGFNRGTAENAGMSAEEIEQMLAAYDEENGMTVPAEQEPEDESDTDTDMEADTEAAQITDQSADNGVGAPVGNA